MIGHTVVLVASLAFGGLDDSRSNEMRPLSDAVEEAATPYAFTRCAALNLSLMEWTGSERMGEATWGAMEQNFQVLAIGAAMLAQSEAGGSLDAHASNTTRQIRRIADLYLDRFDSNYALSGQAFAEDLVVNSDLSFCRELVEAFSD